MPQAKLVRFYSEERARIGRSLQHPLLMTKNSPSASDLMNIACLVIHEVVAKNEQLRNSSQLLLVKSLPSMTTSCRIRVS